MNNTFRTVAMIIGQMSIGQISWDPRDFAEMKRATKRNAIALKRIGIDWTKANPDDITHGRLSTPAVLHGEVANNYELYNAVRERAALTGGQVTVIGHGWLKTPGECFVWRGDAQAFCEYWKGD